MSEPMIAIPVSLAEKLIEHLEWDGEPELTGYQYGSRCDARAKELRHYLDSSSLVRGGSFTVHGKSPYISTGFVPSVLAFKLPAGTHELLLIDAAMRAQGDGGADHA